MIRQDDPRRWKERADGSMVMEDHAAPANCPRDVINPHIAHNDAQLDASKVMPFRMEMEAVFHDARRRMR
jgi:hypothetical protein